MEGLFQGTRLADVSMIGQPNVNQQRLENPIPLPGALSFLAYGTFQSYVRGLNEFPKEDWPDNIELIYYAFHIMITLGTIFILIMAWANWKRWRGRLESRLRSSLGTHVGVSISIHCNQPRLDDSGNGPAALAGLMAYSGPTAAIARWLALAIPSSRSSVLSGSTLCSVFSFFI